MKQLFTATIAEKRKLFNPLKTKKMGVHLREKKLDSGQISYYLDIYHNKKRWYEFLEIHINKKKPSEDDKEKKRLAQEIRSQRENDLIVQDNGLVDKNKRKADFVTWLENYIENKTTQNSHNKSSLKSFKKYLGKKPLPFTAITPEFIMSFGKFLLKNVSNNTAFLYLADISIGLEEAVRQDIISVNPFRKIPRHEKIKQKSVFRQAYTFEQLELLARTPVKIHPQIKQVYFFSCFTGLRWSDVNCLRWSDVINKQIDGNEEWFIYYRQEKTEGIEYLPLSDQAIVILKERKQELLEYPNKSPYIFPFIKEYDEKNKLMQIRVWRALKKWAKAAGLDPKLLTFHTGRHTFATNVLENSPDADLWTVSKLLGHKSIHSTQIYAHVRDTKKFAAVKGLPKLKLIKSEAA
jgi:integrase